MDFVLGLPRTQRGVQVFQDGTLYSLQESCRYSWDSQIVFKEVVRLHGVQSQLHQIKTASSLAILGELFCICLTLH